MKDKIPTEEEVRRFFQEHNYSTIVYDSETGGTRVQSEDLTQMIYPSGDDND